MQNKTIFNTYSPKTRLLISNGVLPCSDKYDTTTDLYYCPICLRPYTFDDVENGTLTDEHFPPDSLGGTGGKILTCKDCNNGDGNKGDTELRNVLKNYIEFTNSFQILFPNGTNDGLIKHENITNPELKGKKILCEIQDSNFPQKRAFINLVFNGTDTPEYEFIAKKTNPHIYGDLLKASLRPFENIGYTFKLCGFNSVPHRTILKIMYLTFLVEMGIEIAFHEFYNPVRQYLQSIEKINPFLAYTLGVTYKNMPTPCIFSLKNEGIDFYHNCFKVIIDKKPYNFHFSFPFPTQTSFFDCYKPFLPKEQNIYLNYDFDREKNEMKIRYNLIQNCKN